MNKRITLEFDTPPMRSDEQGINEYVEVLALDLANQIIGEMQRLEREENVEYWKNYFVKWDMRDMKKEALANAQVILKEYK